MQLLVARVPALPLGLLDAELPEAAPEPGLKSRLPSKASNVLCCSRLIVVSPLPSQGISWYTFTIQHRSLGFAGWLLGDFEKKRVHQSAL
jgi:hypothetical protein